MAERTITKRALATALKELMVELPLAKISVGSICERCKMNRKSFYYHFKDKEDLINWIFDTEFLEIYNEGSQNSLLGIMDAMIRYLYDNKAFYRKVLKTQGQNSFSEHLRLACHLIIKKCVEKNVDDIRISKIQMNFFADGIICAIKRWLLERNPISPDEFMNEIRTCILVASKHTPTNVYT